MNNNNKILSFVYAVKRTGDYFHVASPKYVLYTRNINNVSTYTETGGGGVCEWTDSLSLLCRSVSICFRR